MSAVTVIQHLPDQKRVLYALTVEQYHQMLADAILPEGEPFELIHGQITRKDRSADGDDVMTVGERHIWCVKRLAKLGLRLEGSGCHMQTQQPISLPPFNEPEPDAAIVIGTEDDYLTRKPGAADVTCVIEVADSSLNYDQTVKLAIYAGSGIAAYFIVNLKDNVVEAYSEPQPNSGLYTRVATLMGDQIVRLPAINGVELSVPARELLP
jgi:Uma2 family endonuclease